jgi:ATP-dependent Clp protease ATP-binding subunit ClpA
MEMIVDKFIAELNQQLTIKKVALTISPAVRTWLAKKGHDPAYGARPLSRVIQTEIKDKLSDELLFGELQNGGFVSLDVTGGQLSFNYG